MCLEVLYLLITVFGVILSFNDTLSLEHVLESSLFFIWMKIWLIIMSAWDSVSRKLFIWMKIWLIMQVHKATTLLQHYAAVCNLSDATIWKPKLGWNALQTSLVNAVWFLYVMLHIWCLFIWKSVRTFCNLLIRICYRTLYVFSNMYLSWNASNQSCFSLDVFSNFV